MTERGRFITLEGGEGAGKSTQAAALAAALAAAGRRVVRTREPGGAPGAEAIRGLLLGDGPRPGPPSGPPLSPPLDPGWGPWEPQTEALLHFAARREHLVRTIRPALAAGDWVVSDRFADSTLAYQGYGQGLPRAVFDALAAVTLDGLAPDLTLILDLPPELGLARAAARATADRYERLGRDFHARVRAGFLAIAAAEPGRCVVIDATAAPEAVAMTVLDAVRARLGT